jgi:ribosomal protein L19
MFSVTPNKLGLLQKINFIVLKSFFFNRITVKRYKKTILNFFFKAGDILTLNIVRLEKNFKTLQKKPTSQKVVGRVLAKYNKGLHSYFILRNVYSGIPIEYTFTIISPMILSIRVLQSFRRIKFRAKVYFFRFLSNTRNKIKFKFVNKTIDLERYKQRTLRNFNKNYNTNILYKILNLIF